MISNRYIMRQVIEDVDPIVISVTNSVGQVLDPATTTRCQICLAEALSNIVKYARPTHPGATIEITIIETDSVLTVDILEPAGTDAFDLRDHAVDLATVDPLAESGRGLGLILQCADAVDYGPVQDRNRLALRFCKHSEDATPSSNAATPTGE